MRTSAVRAARRVARGLRGRRAGRTSSRASAFTLGRRRRGDARRCRSRRSAFRAAQRRRRRRCSGFGQALEEPRTEPRAAARRAAVRLRSTIDNPLVPGRYSIICSIARSRRQRRLRCVTSACSTSSSRAPTRCPGMVTVRLERASVAWRPCRERRLSVELRAARRRRAVSPRRRLAALLGAALLIAVTEFKRTYFGTVLGYLWSVARPLLLFAVLLEVFTHVFRLGCRCPTIRCSCC